MSHHLAQVNIAKLLAPIDSPQIADFFNALDEVNALAESSPGFVWRLVGDGNDATSLRPFDDPDTIVNMSVWESPEQLKTYAYRGLHVEFFKRRHEWFHTTDRAVAAWWVNAGQIPPSTMPNGAPRFSPNTARLHMRSTSARRWPN
jgi:Domain of unknown function (DUF3291)